jgi:hypothetical protein
MCSLETKERKPLMVFENPKERAKYNLISDYGTAIDTYLKKLE